MRLHVHNEASLKRFNRLKHKYNKIVIKYHMNGCMHCEDFRSTWKQCTKNANNKKVLFVNLDSSVLSNHELDNQFKQVHGFPTIKLFSKKPKTHKFKVKTFKQKRSKKNVLKFLKSK